MTSGIHTDPGQGSRLIYRKAAENDCAQIYDLICELEVKKLPFERFREIFLSQLKDPHCHCLVCESENRVIAVLNLRFEEQLHHCEYIAEITEFAVASACRGRGIGKAMLKKAGETAKAFGCVQMEAACNQLRKDTHRFYLREGMKNYHYKFSVSLTGETPEENALGR